METTSQTIASKLLFWKTRLGQSETQVIVDITLAMLMTGSYSRNTGSR